MKIYAGYTGRVKNVGEGFYSLNGISANIKTADIYIREFDEAEIAQRDDGYKAMIVIPGNAIGSAYLMSGPRSIWCRSVGEAENIMSAREHKNRAVAAAIADGWHTSPACAAKEALTDLFSRAEAAAERKSMTVEKATVDLIAAGIFESHWTISPRVWGKKTTRQRVQDALAGDKCAAGCLRRDAVKSGK